MMIMRSILLTKGGTSWKNDIIYSACTEGLMPTMTSSNLLNALQRLALISAFIDNYLFIHSPLYIHTEFLYINVARHSANF